MKDETREKLRELPGGSLVYRHHEIAELIEKAANIPGGISVSEVSFKIAQLVESAVQSARNEAHEETRKNLLELPITDEFGEPITVREYTRMQFAHAAEKLVRAARNKALAQAASHVLYFDEFASCTGCDWTSTKGIGWAEHIRALKTDGTGGKS